MIAKARSITFGILALLLLTACGSSPPVRYFSLSTTVASGTQDSDDAVVLGLGPLRMAEYLDRSQIVTRGAGAEMSVDEFSRWAEPLIQAFHRVVSTDVDNMMDDVIVLAFPWESVVRTQVDYRLLGDVIRFDADRSGRVVLETQWGISAVESGESFVRAHRSRYEAQTGSPNDPAAVASAMNEALSEFSRDIATQFENALQE